MRQSLGGHTGEIAVGKVEWYRRSSWTPDDQADFQARLKRSRGSFHKAQYLRLQALALQEVGTEPLLTAALSLLDQLLRDHVDASQLASAHQQRAECLADLGRYEEALISYRAAFEAQRNAPNWRTEAYLGFGELVLGLKLRDMYREAVTVLEEFGGGEVFPASQYRHATIRALTCDATGDLAGARLYAGRALAAAAKAESPFRYHRQLGLVRFVDPEVMDRLRALCAA
jgi:tetratricopeptide (TPR) repeat protein